MDGLEDWASAHLTRTDAVVFEASVNAWELYDLLAPLVARVSVAHPQQVKLIAGDLHEMGRKRAEGLLLAYAVQRNGGPDIVNDNQLLWTQQARLKAERTLIIGYELLAGAITTLLFALGVLAMQRLKQKPVP